MASPDVREEPSLLAFALLWYDHVRARGRANEQTSLCLFVGEDAGTLTAHRLRWLAAETLRPACRFTRMVLRVKRSAGT